ncbi:MAG TPA: HAMP domain-containing sensor histidine kinase [Gaiellaceae bacterium]
MSTAVAAIDYLNLALYLLAGAAALRVWRRSGSRAGGWSASAFGVLAVVVVVGRVLPDDPTGAMAVVLRVLILLLVCFPYLLYRFTRSFEVASARVARLVGLLTLAMLAWTIALPTLPGRGDPRPAWFWAYVAAFLVHWTLLTAVSARLLWRAGRDQPSVARRRMRLLAVATVVITAALFLGVPGGSRDSVLALVAAAVSSLSAITFAIALDPPALVRAIWRRPEQDRIQAAIGELMRAHDERDVAARVLPPMARLVGASGVALVAPGGRLLGSHPDPDAPPADEAPETLAIDLEGTTLLVRTSRYAPFFGTEELQLLRTLGWMTALALDHARLLAGEREARAALERADELKTQFVAFAAHELRSPIATVVGLVETLEQRDGQLRPDLALELRRTLAEQARRVRLLVDQLLDLSRLDAEAVEISVEPVAVRAQVEQIVESLGDPSVELAIEPALAAELDTVAFGHIVENLITNAIRYGSAPIVVRAVQSDRHFRLTVEDRGPGVPPDFVPQLFERFARADETRDVPGGSGLGLAIARSYAQAHQGDLVYEPAAGGGARFELVLPRRQASAAVDG